MKSTGECHCGANRMLRSMTACAVALLLACPALADGDVANGKKLIKAWECTQCHGLTGNDRSAQEFPVPMLAGQPEAYLIRRMIQYKTLDLGYKPWRRMKSYTKGLSEQDIADIAAYYSAQKRY